MQQHRTLAIPAQIPPKKPKSPNMRLVPVSCPSFTQSIVFAPDGQPCDDIFRSLFQLRHARHVFIADGLYIQVHHLPARIIYLNTSPTPTHSCQSRFGGSHPEVGAPWNPLPTFPRAQMRKGASSVKYNIAFTCHVRGK